MLKIVGALLIISGTALIGIKKVIKLKKREKSLESLCSSLNLLKNEISDRLVSTEEAIKILAESDSLSSVLFKNIYKNLKDIGYKPFSEIWAEAIDNTKPLYLTDKEKQYLKELGHGLGRYSSYEQGKLIEYCLRKLEDAHKVAQKEVERDSKMHAVLGMSAGIFAVIIFI